MIPDGLGLDLERLIAGEILGSEFAPPLEVAAFLDDFDIPDSGEFTMWKDRQQARLLPLIKDALVLLIDRCRRTGDSQQIEHLADRMLALDELSEEAVRAKMEARAFAGDRLAALKIYEQWKNLVAEELGALPSASLDSMAARLRGRGLEQRSGPLPKPHTDHWQGRSFVGRTAEYQVLYEAWEQVRKGRPTHAIVLGDSGIGKTTLIDRLTTAASLAGAVISRTQCYDLERQIPYAVLGNLIHGLLEHPGVTATSPEALAELARAVPEIGRRFPGLPTIDESRGETARIHLSESFQQMLDAVAEEHPVILVVDDLHLADEASLGVLHLVMRRSAQEPIMTLFAARPAELMRSPQAARLREAAALPVREVVLAPLNGEDSLQLLQSLLSADQRQPSASTRKTLVKAAAGFPMVIELLVQDWHLHGSASLALALGAMTTDLQTDRPQNTTYGRILARVVETLDLQAQSVLTLAALLGPRLTDLSMYTLLDVTHGQCIAALAQLAKVRLLRDTRTGLEFVNELVRAQAYASIPASLRRNLHGLVATRLLAITADSEASSGLEVAWHCIRAGLTEQAIPHLLRGARQAASHGASHEAERALASALPSLANEHLVEATLLLAEVLQEQGHWQDSLDHLEQLDSSVVGALLDDVATLVALARLNASTAGAEATYDRLPDLVRIIKDCHTPRTRVRAAKVTAYLLERHRDEQVSADLLTHVEAIPISSLDPDSEGELGLAKAMLLYQAGQTSRSLEQASRTIEELRRRKAANLLVVQLEAGLVALRFRQGEYELALEHCERALALAHRLGNDTVITGLAANLMLCLARLGRYEEQAAWAEKVPHTNVAELTGFAEVQLTYSLALGLAMRKSSGSALNLLSRMDERLVGRVPHWLKQAWLLEKADILFICDRKREAYRTAKQGLGDHPTLYSQSFAGAFARWLSLTSDSYEHDQVLATIDALVADLDRFDALDQVEILCARLRLDRTEAAYLSDVATRVRNGLSRLPTAVRSQLVALGMLL